METIPLSPEALARIDERVRAIVVEEVFREGFTTTDYDIVATTHIVVTKRQLITSAITGVISPTDLDAFLAQSTHAVRRTPTPLLSHNRFITEIPIVGLAARIMPDDVHVKGIGPSSVLRTRQWLASNFPVLERRYDQPMGPLERKAFEECALWNFLGKFSPRGMMLNRVDLQRAFGESGWYQTTVTDLASMIRSRDTRISHLQELLVGHLRYIGYEIDAS
jgi:hypothetical protein